MRRTVDFPHPDGPTIATNSPSATVRSSPARAVTSRPRDREKDFETPVRQTAEDLDTVSWSGTAVGAFRDMRLLGGARWGTRVLRERRWTVPVN